MRLEPFVPVSHGIHNRQRGILLISPREEHEAGLTTLLQKGVRRRQRSAILVDAGHERVGPFDGVCDSLTACFQSEPHHRHDHSASNKRKLPLEAAGSPWPFPCGGRPRFLRRGADGDSEEASGLPSAVRETAEERILRSIERIARRDGCQSLLNALGVVLRKFKPQPSPSEFLGDDQRRATARKRVHDEVARIGRDLDDAREVARAFGSRESRLAP